MGWLTTVGTVGGAIAGGVLGGPLGAGVGMSAGGALGGWLDGAFDSPDPLDPYQPDAGLYDTSALDSISGSAKQQAAAAAARQAPTTNWGMSDADRALALEARGRQGKLADEYEAVLRGERESLAQRQLAAGTQRVIQQQANAAANVRGGAGNQLAAFDMAQRSGVAAGVEQNRLAAELRAREESDARAQLAGVLGTMRGQDLSMRGQSQGQAQFDTSTKLQQTSLNDAMQRAAWQRELDAAQASAGVKTGYAGAQQSATMSVQGINAQREQAAQDRKADAVQGAVQGGSGLVQMGVMNGNSWGGKPAPGPAPAQPAPAPAQAPADPWADSWEKSGGGSYSAWKDPWKLWLDPTSGRALRGGLLVAAGGGGPAVALPIAWRDELAVSSGPAPVACGDRRSPLRGLRPRGESAVAAAAIARQPGPGRPNNRSLARVTITATRAAPRPIGASWPPTLSEGAGRRGRGPCLTPLPLAPASNPIGPRPCSHGQHGRLSDR